MADILDDIAPVSGGGSGDQKPISSMDRIILQNLFDTQPKRRAAYLEKLGYQMNPKDENEYRPIGSTGGFAEIDPGFIDEYKRGGLKAVGQEALKDLGDVAFDTAIAGPASVGGAALGGMGGLAGGPLAIPAAILGGAGGNALAEGIKKNIGDILLDKDVPIDKQGLIIQSVFAGLGPQVLKGAKVAGKEALDVYLRSRRDAIINAAKQSGNGLNEEILNKAVKNPEMFTREAVDNASGKLKDLYKNIFGIEDPLKLDAPDRINKNSMFGEKLNPLNAAANSEIDRLGSDQNANLTFNEIASPFIQKIEELSNKFDRTSDEDAALSYLKNQLSTLKNRTTAIVNGKPQQGEINFKQAREWLSARQSEVSAKDSAGNYLLPEGRVIAPALGGGDGLLSIVNKKAQDIGSNLPKINAERSRILQAYNIATDTLTPSNITSAFIGNDSPKKQLIKDAAGEIDSVLGTNLVPQIETGAMQRVVENMYTNPKAFGSGRVNSSIAQGAIKQGLAGGAAGAGVGAAIAGSGGVGPGALIGGIGGALKGASEGAMLGNPEKALESLGKNSSRISNLAEDLAKPQTNSLPANIAASEVGRSVGEAVTPNQAPAEEHDPLKDIFGP